MEMEGAKKGRSEQWTWDTEYGVQKLEKSKRMKRRETLLIGPGMLPTLL